MSRVSCWTSDGRLSPSLLSWALLVCAPPSLAEDGWEEAVVEPSEVLSWLLLGRGHAFGVGVGEDGDEGADDALCDGGMTNLAFVW